MNVSLTPKLEAFVRRKVASGLYNNASEVVREALRTLIEREAVPAPAPEQARSAPSLADVRAALADLEGTLRDKGITSVAVFGSLVRGEAGPASDVDVLIDVDPVARFSLVDLVDLKNLLEDRLRHRVDVVTREGLDPHARERVLGDAEVVF